MNICIKNGLVLNWTGDSWELEKTDIIIEGNRIRKNISFVSPDCCYVIDATGKLIMPGLINAHTHAYMTIHRNLADDLSFFEWLNLVQKVEEQLNEEDIYWATKLAIIEMIKSGTTCFVDMNIKSAKLNNGPFSAAAGAVKESGVRAVISRGLAGIWGSEDIEKKYKQAIREMDLFRDEKRLQFIHGPHAPYSCMPNLLQMLTESCKTHHIGQTIHLSESKKEIEDIQEEYGMSPIKLMDRLGVFDVPVIAAHCVYVNDEDIRIMAEKKVSIAINPTSNMKLGNGFAPVKKFMEANINVCLGTDGSGSNNCLNMFHEMNIAALVYKGDNREAQCIGASDVLRMATINGAKAIGHCGELGEIKEGALADLIIINLDEPQYYPYNNIISGLVYSSNGSEVDTVIIDGRIIMENKIIKTINVSEVYEKCQNLMERIRNNLED